jgi:hypothetical protein
MTSRSTVADWVAAAMASINGLEVGQVEHPLTR